MSRQINAIGKEILKKQHQIIFRNIKTDRKDKFMMFGFQSTTKQMV